MYVYFVQVAVRTKTVLNGIQIHFLTQQPSRLVDGKSPLVKNIFNTLKL